MKDAAVGLGKVPNDHGKARSSHVNQHKYCRRCGAELAAVASDDGTDDRLKWVARVNALKVRLRYLLFVVAIASVRRGG